MNHKIKARHAKRLAFRGNVPVYLMIGAFRTHVNGTNWSAINKQYRTHRAEYWIIY